MRGKTIRERSYKEGRSNGAVLDNETLRVLQTVSTLNVDRTNREDGPEPVIDRGLYLDDDGGELRYYDIAKDKWLNVFGEKFQITDQMLTDYPSDSPVFGQLWLNQDVLFYYDGNGWRPVKTILEDKSELNVSIFEDFLILDPINQIGSTIEEDEQYAQFLVPRVDTGRFYSYGHLKEGYDRVNAVTVQYDKRLISENNSTWVHVNPAKLRNVEKKLFLLDKTSQFINHTSSNTEFYGFRRESYGGSLLRPTVDYKAQHQGILLSDVVALKYDFILAVHYSFGWIRSSGELEVLDEKLRHTFATTGLTGGVNVFVEGYQLDPKQYTYDPVDDYVEITDPEMDDDLEVMVMSNVEHMESGVIKAQYTHNRATIRLRKKYTNPLVFVNGEALHAGSDSADLQYDSSIDRMYITGAHANMEYTVMDLYVPSKIKGVPDADSFVSSGHVSLYSDTQQTWYIPIPDVPEDKHVMLFVEGNAVTKEAIYTFHDENGQRCVAIDGDEGECLEQMQRYIVLLDTFHALYSEGDNRDVIRTNSADEALVYVNGFLQLDHRFITKLNLAEAEREDNRIVSAFDENLNTYNYYSYSTYYNEWQLISDEDAAYIEQLTNTYTQAPRSILFRERIGNDADVRVYAYKLASRISNPLIVGRMEGNVIPDESENKTYDELLDWYGQDTFYLKNVTYVPGRNSLQVFVDGVRQYDVEEMKLGNGFKLPYPVIGIVSYIIEKPDEGEVRSCEREVLDASDAIDNGRNIYRTKESLYPGSLTVYVSGIRQPKESYTILDAHTIMFKDATHKLIGSTDTFPTLSTIDYNDEAVDVPMMNDDRILIERRNLLSRNEDSFVFTSFADGVSIDLDERGINHDIVDTKDHMLFFLDGRFLGLRWNNEEYELVPTQRKILIHDKLYEAHLETNPLYTLVASDPVLAEQYERLFNKSIEDITKDHLLTIEWR